jgi:hypothetical protein
MIERFEKETKELLQPHHGFLRQPKDLALTWDGLLGWCLSQSQETIALNGPAIFTLFTTIAVNRTARRKLDAKVTVALEELSEDGPPAASSEDELPFFEQSTENLAAAAAAAVAPDLDDPDGEDDPDILDDGVDTSLGRKSLKTRLAVVILGRYVPKFVHALSTSV